MTFLCLLIHLLLSFATFSSVSPFFYIPGDSNLMQFSLSPLLLCVMGQYYTSVNSIYPTARYRKTEEKWSQFSEWMCKDHCIKIKCHATITRNNHNQTIFFYRFLFWNKFYFSQNFRHVIPYIWIKNTNLKQVNFSLEFSLRNKLKKYFQEIMKKCGYKMY
jgi:hypothetical protein